MTKIEERGAHRKVFDSELQRKKQSEKIVTNFIYCLMALPAVGLVFVIAYLPMGGAVVAFKDYNYVDGIWGSPWTKPIFKNFIFLFRSSDTASMFLRTIFYSIIRMILTPVASIFIAILMNELRSRRAVKVYQTILTWPNYLSAVILSYIAYVFLSPRAGLLGQIYKMMGKTPINVYNLPGPWKIIIPVIGIWAAAGAGSLLYYSTLINIDPTYYEAAALDGASRWQMIWRISIPHLRPVIAISFILSIGGLLSSDFGLFYNLPMGSPLVTKELTVLDTYIYKALAGNGNIGLSSAVDFLKSIVSTILIITTNLIVRKIDPDSALF